MIRLHEVIYIQNIFIGLFYTSTFRKATKLKQLFYQNCKDFWILSVKLKYIHAMQTKYNVSVLMWLRNELILKVANMP